MRANKLARITLFLSLAAVSPSLLADPQAHYLANEGVMITHGEVKVLFDPLFDESYGRYELLPAEMEQDLFAGTPPFDGIDAVFVSHHHGDHFAPASMLSFLKKRTDIRLYAPAQAVSALRDVARPEDEAVFERITGLAFENGDEPITLTVGDLLIEAVRIPHSGWPQRMMDIENIAFRVTLDKSISVLHLGDADPNPAHFLSNSDHWEGHEPDLALPPYWFFSSDGGQFILAEYINPDHAIGIHVPAAMSDDPTERPEEFKGYDLFTNPGETREIKRNE